MVLIEVVRCVGIAVALLGAFVTAPSGAQQLGARLLDGMRHFGRAILRHLPWYRHSVNVRVPSARGTAAITLPALTITASGWAWSPNAAVSEQIERLRQRTNQLATDLERLRNDVRKEVQVLGQQIGALEASHEQALASLRTQLETRERLVAQIDASGLPLIGLGIVLTGLPDRWLVAPVAWGLLCFTTGVLLLTVERRWVR